MVNDASPRLSPRADPHESAAPQRKRVLVVDDHRDAARILALLIESLGHEVRTANEGVQALELVRGFHPDVIFLDIGLPQADGYEIAKRVRAMPEGRNARLVALTGWGHGQARERSREAGFDQHLVKPAAAKDLRVLLTD
jgi:CheY-like chemotaxis protein